MPTNRIAKMLERSKSELVYNGNVAELMIYDVIDKHEGISSKQVVEQLKGVPASKTINLRLNSQGGDVFEGLAIYNALHRHKSRVEVDIDGMALSIASVIAMAGDEIRMADNAMFMIHDPWTMTGGNAGELRDTADLLDKTKEQLLTTYVNRTGADRSELSRLMSAETWFDANEAKDFGFVTKVSPGKKIAAHFESESFKAVPSRFAARARETFTPRLTAAKAKLDQLRRKHGL